MPSISTRRISTKLADQIIRDTGLSARGYSLMSLVINGSPAFQLSRADEIVEFNAKEIFGAVKTLNAFAVARSVEHPVIKGDALMAIPAVDRDALRDVLKAAAEDAGLIA